MTQTKFKVELSELTYQAQFTTPLFEVIGSSSKLLATLYEKYQHLGLRWSDIKAGALATNLGNWEIQFSLGLLATFRLKLDSLNLTFLNPFRTEAGIFIAPSEGKTISVQELTETYHAALDETLHSLPIQSLAFILNSHCRVEGKSAHDYMQRFKLSIPEGLGETNGTGVAFYFIDRSENHVSRVVLDKSTWIEDGIFFSILSTYTDSQLEIPQFAERAQAYFDRVLRILEIELD